MSLAQTADIMTRTCNDLEAYRKQVSWEVDNNGGDSAKQDWLTQLADYIDKLRPAGAEGSRVLAGDAAYPFSPRWTKNAQDVHNQLASEIKDVSNWGISGLWSQVAVQSAVDLKETAKNAKDGLEANFYPVLILVVVGLIALAVIKVA